MRRAPFLSGFLRLVPSSNDCGQFAWVLGDGRERLDGHLHALPGVSKDIGIQGRYTDRF